MTANEVVVTRKGQITIPVELRKKFGIEESSKGEVIEEEGKIVIKKRPSIFDLAGSGVGKGNVDELKTMLDNMRDETCLKDASMTRVFFRVLLFGRPRSFKKTQGRT
jgi:AbrB family looped-hinge helix DNA binding protein